jgi:hypothetical protein
MILDARQWLHGSAWRRTAVRGGILASVLTLTIPAPSTADDAADAAADRETKALDSTATQWSFQGAYQWMPDYYDDVVNGAPRPPGLDNYVQLRIVAPIPLEKFTLLPRLTIRHYENLANKESGFGNTELFALVIPKPWDWGSGRMGIGPLVTLPGDEKVARNEWGYGFAAAAVNAQGKWFYGLLFTQTWRAVDPEVLPAGTSDTSPLGIAPFLNYRLSKGWYVGNGDMVAKWDWDSSKFYLPIGVRVGKVIVQETSSWNLYAEYQTSLVYKDWPGSAVKSSWRFNASYTIPVGS